MKTVRIFKDGANDPVLERVQVADNLWTRFWGLMGRREMGEYDGLLITSSSSVHTMFMRFTIDVVYLDRDGRVLKIATVKPFRASACRGAKQVVELPAGRAAERGITAGDMLRLTEA